MLNTPTTPDESTSTTTTDAVAVNIVPDVETQSKVSLSIMPHAESAVSLTLYDSTALPLMSPREREEVDADVNDGRRSGSSDIRNRNGDGGDGGDVDGGDDDGGDGGDGGGGEEASDEEGVEKEKKKRRRRIMYPGEGIVQDLRRRVPWLLRDVIDGIHPKTIPSTLFIFFTSLAPALTFGVMLQMRTGGEQGIIEVIFTTALCGMIYAVLAGQPMLIVGVTGPICIYCISIYTLANQFGIPYLPWLSVIGLWSAVMHFLLAFSNLSYIVRFITRFTLETFGILIAIIYLVDAFKVLVNLYISDRIEVSLFSTLWAFGTCALAYALHGARSWTVLPGFICKVFADFAVPISIAIFTGLAYVPWFYNLQPYFLEVPSDFSPTSDRNWWVVVQYGELPLWSYFAAILPAMLLTGLIFFDHNVSSMMTQLDEFKLKKGTAYHYDLFVVGIMIAVCSLLGLPFTHGLIPQAPMHVRALATVKVKMDKTTGKKSEHIVSVRETRLTGLIQSAVICILAIWGQVIIRVFPESILTGLFLFMGVTSLEEGQFWSRIKLLFVCGEKRSQYYGNLLFVRHVHAVKQIIFTLLQISCAVVIYAVTETPVGLIFPLLVLLLIPVRSFLMPFILSKRDLYYLDNDKNTPDELDPLTEEEKEKIRNKKWRVALRKVTSNFKRKSREEGDGGEATDAKEEDPIENLRKSSLYNPSNVDLELQEMKAEKDVSRLQEQEMDTGQKEQQQAAPVEIKVDDDDYEK